MSKLLRQVKLVTKDESGVRQMTTWVDDRPDLKRGVVIKLDKMPDTAWYVEELYNTKLTETQVDLNRGWTNNI